MLSTLTEPFNYSNVISKLTLNSSLARWVAIVVDYVSTINEREDLLSVLRILPEVNQSKSTIIRVIKELFPLYLGSNRAPLSITSEVEYSQETLQQFKMEEVSTFLEFEGTAYNTREGEDYFNYVFSNAKSGLRTSMILKGLEALLKSNNCYYLKENVLTTNHHETYLFQQISQLNYFFGCTQKPGLLIDGLINKAVDQIETHLLEIGKKTPEKLVLITDPVHRAMCNNLQKMSKGSNVNTATKNYEITLSRGDTKIISFYDGVIKDKSITVHPYFRDIAVKGTFAEYHPHNVISKQSEWCLSARPLLTVYDGKKDEWVGLDCETLLKHSMRFDDTTRKVGGHYMQRYTNNVDKNNMDSFFVKKTDGNVRMIRKFGELKTLTMKYLKQFTCTFIESITKSMGQDFIQSFNSDMEKLCINIKQKKGSLLRRFASKISFAPININNNNTPNFGALDQNILGHLLTDEAFVNINNNNALKDINLDDISGYPVFETISDQYSSSFGNPLEYMLKMNKGLATTTLVKKIFSFFFPNQDEATIGLRWAIIQMAMFTDELRDNNFNLNNTFGGNVLNGVNNSANIFGIPMQAFTETDLIPGYKEVDNLKKNLKAIAKFSILEKFILICFMLSGFTIDNLVNMDSHGLPLPLVFWFIRCHQICESQKMLVAPTGGLMGNLVTGFDNVIDEKSAKRHAVAFSLVKLVAPVIHSPELAYIQENVFVEKWVSGLGTEINREENGSMPEIERFVGVKDAYVFLGGLEDFETKSGHSCVSGTLYVENEIYKKGTVKINNKVSPFYNHVFGFDKLEDKLDPIFTSKSGENSILFSNLITKENCFNKGVSVEGACTHFSYPGVFGGMKKGIPLQFSSVSCSQIGYDYKVDLN